jgi:hypothetical protein
MKRVLILTILLAGGFTPASAQNPNVLQQQAPNMPSPQQMPAEKRRRHPSAGNRHPRHHGPGAGSQSRYDSGHPPARQPRRGSDSESQISKIYAGTRPCLAAPRRLFPF